MGHSLLRACQRRSPLSLSLRKSPSSFIKMVDNVETTTPTIEEVAAPVADNGEAAAVTEEVKTSENGANGTHEETKEPEVESTNGAADKTEEKEETTEEATEETTKETTEESTEESTEEATKRKADAPSEEETVEKIAKLKETAAEVVA